LALPALLALAAPRPAHCGEEPISIDGQGRVHPRRLLVAPHAAEGGLADAVRRAAEVEAALARAGTHTLRDLPQIGWRVVELEDSDLLAAKARLEQSGLFRHVSLDHAMQLAHVPNDPYWPQWHMLQIRADLAWDLERGDPAVSVAVIDTGIEVSHPDLAANMWTNPGETAGNGVDDDGNGYVDDVYGYDFAYDDSDPDDVYGHGTPCAGIVAAVQDNSIGVTGVAPGCRVGALKAAIDSGYLYDSAVVPALLYAADMGFQVASMSFYGDQVTPAQGDAIAYCHTQGLLPVAAAGNDYQVLPYYPAAFEGTLAVGSTGGGDVRSWFSNYGTWVGVAAPGEGTSSCVTGGSYTTGFSGTSAACPHAAGLAALLFSAAPTATAAEVRAAIEDTAVLLNEPPYGTWAAYGRIDARAAVERILGMSSGSVSARLDFVSPSGGALPCVPHGVVARAPGVRLHGVGFEEPSLAVLHDGAPLTLKHQGRRVVRVPAPETYTGLLELEVGGLVVDSLVWEPALGWLYTPTDACTHAGGSAEVDGGFWELYRADGTRLTCTRGDGGRIQLLLPIRDVRLLASSEVWLEFTRSYTNTSGGVETVRLYDWSTGSYPYGSWETISTRTISSSTEEALELDLTGDPTRFLDVAGTVYVEVETDGVSWNGELRADALRLRVR